MGRQIRVVIVDDHAIVREGITALLSTTDDLGVIGGAADADSGLELIERLSPDVVIADLSMQSKGGLALLKQLQTMALPPGAIVLSMYQDDEWVRASLDAGALSYVVKGADLSELITAIREAAAGRRYLSSQVRRARSARSLTQREVEVLTLVAQGRTSRQAARVLSISTRTVEHHRQRMMLKLGIRDVAGLTRYALRWKLIDDP